jgi:molecular chaperone DnaK
MTIEKLARASALILQAQRQLKEVTLDFGTQFAISYRTRIEDLCTELSSGIEQNSEQVIDTSYTNLKNVLYELNLNVRAYYTSGSDDDSNGSFPENNNN